MGPSPVEALVESLGACMGMDLVHFLERSRVPAVKLTMTEAHSWNVPDDILAGGRGGWPAILSGLKSVLETGNPLDIKMEPPKELMEAVKRAVVEKPWQKQAS